MAFVDFSAVTSSADRDDAGLWAKSGSQMALVFNH
jgi:hypothetical protein